MIKAIQRLGMKAVHKNTQELEKITIGMSLKKTPSESDEIHDKLTIRQTSDLWISQYFGRSLKERSIFSEREF